MMKPLICFSLFLLSLLFIVSVVESGVAGGWNPINNIGDPYVVEIAKFAVSEHNKQTKQNLVYDVVGKGREQQVVDGKRYDLIVFANNGREMKEYEAFVVDNPSKHLRRLESFKMVM